MTSKTTGIKKLWIEEKFKSLQGQLDLQATVHAALLARVETAEKNKRTPKDMDAEIYNIHKRLDLYHSEIRDLSATVSTHDSRIELQEERVEGVANRHADRLQQLENTVTSRSTANATTMEKLKSRIDALYAITTRMQQAKNVGGESSESQAHEAWYELGKKAGIREERGSGKEFNRGFAEGKRVGHEQGRKEGHSTRQLPNGDINLEYSRGYEAGVQECKKALSYV